MTAHDKDSFISILDRFLTPTETDHPMLLEVFTETEDESNALEATLKYIEGPKDFCQLIKSVVKAVVGEKGE